MNTWPYWLTDWYGFGGRVEGSSPNRSTIGSPPLLMMSPYMVIEALFGLGRTLEVNLPWFLPGRVIYPLPVVSTVSADVECLSQWSHKLYFPNRTQQSCSANNKRHHNQYAGILYGFALDSICDLPLIKINLSSGRHNQHRFTVSIHERSPATNNTYPSRWAVTGDLIYLYMYLSAWRPNTITVQPGVEEAQELAQSMKTKFSPSFLNLFCGFCTSEALFVCTVEFQEWHCWFGYHHHIISWFYSIGI